jgi:hypothetical protein
MGSGCIREHSKLRIGESSERRLARSKWRSEGRTESTIAKKDAQKRRETQRPGHQSCQCEASRKDFLLAHTQGSCEAAIRGRENSATQRTDYCNPSQMMVTSNAALSNR